MTTWYKSDNGIIFQKAKSLTVWFASLTFRFWLFILFLFWYFIHTKYKYINIQLHSLNLNSFSYTIVAIQLANVIRKVKSYDIFILKKWEVRADHIFPSAFHTGCNYNSLEDAIFRNKQSFYIFFQPNSELLFNL